MRLVFLTAAILPVVLPAAANEPFVFGKVDLKLLDEANAIDRALDDRGLVFHDSAIDSRIDAIGRSLIPPGELDNVRWRFHVLRDPTVNAFALPNGSIYINSGLLVRAENDDQVAGVLAHEAVHVARRHGYLANRSIRRKSLILNTAGFVSGWMPAGVAGTVVAVAGSAGQLAVIFSIYGYSRELEREADVVGLDAVKRAGRNPAALVRMLAIFDEKLEPEPVPVFYSDHPKTRRRIDYLKASLPPGAGDFSALDQAYTLRMRPVVVQDIQLEIDARRFRSAVAAASKLAEAEPGGAIAWYWLGEAWRNLGPRRPRLTSLELVAAAQRAAYKSARKLTEAEENAKLAATDEGRAALQYSRGKSEEAFRRAASLDPSAPEPYFGLGALYQDEGKPADALAAYRKCLELTPPGAARGRVDARIAALAAGGAE